MGSSISLLCLAQEKKSLCGEWQKKWRSTKKDEFYQAWQGSLKTYRAALHTAQENKNNPRLLFSTAARLTQNHNSIEKSIPHNSVAVIS